MQPEGVLTLRQHLGFPITPWHRALELEQTDNRLEALLEYGLVSEGDVLGGWGLGAIGTVTATPTIAKKKGKHARISSSLHSQDPDSMETGESVVGDDNDPFAEGTTEEVNAGDDASSRTSANANDYRSRLYKTVKMDRGRLRCLMELGHLDTVVDLTQGVAKRLPELEMALLPLGVEASWRLSRWDKLDVMLSRVDTVQRSIDRDFLEEGPCPLPLQPPGQFLPLWVSSHHIPLCPQVHLVCVNWTATSALDRMWLPKPYPCNQRTSSRLILDDCFSTSLMGKEKSSVPVSNRHDSIPCMPLVQPAWSPMIAHTPC